MAEGSVSQEGESQRKSAWSSLKEAVRTRFSRKPATVVSETPREMLAVPVGSGYAELVESFKDGIEPNDVFLAQMLNDHYPDLISTISSDTRLTTEMRRLLLDGVNSGNKEIIAVVVGRFFDKLKTARKGTKIEVNSSKGIPAQIKIKQTEYLARKMADYFIAEGIARDTTNRPKEIKESWARGRYWDAINAPNWQPKLPTPIPPGISESLKGVVLTPNLPKA